MVEATQPPDRFPSTEEERAEQDLRYLAESMEDGVVLFDSAGRVRVANARLAQLFDIDPRRFSQCRDFDSLAVAMKESFVEPGGAQEFVARWSEIHRRGREAAWDELELMRPGYRVVERFSRPLEDSKGRPSGWLEIFRDLTSARMIEAKRLQTEKMAALGLLVSGIAHELNSPLTSIVGYAQLLQGRLASASGDPGEIAAARMIFQEAERAGRIMRNLLQFARETKPERQAVPLNEIIERAVALRSVEMKMENIVLDLQLDARLQPLSGDGHQLQQALLNLLVNAEQAILQARAETSGAQGAGHVRIRTHARSRNRAVVEISDDGTGIPGKNIARVFDPFFTTKPAGIGTGLGLSLVYGIVREHGGVISVASPTVHAGYKTTFRIELPVGPRAPGFRPAGTPGISRTDERADEAPPRVHPARILVLEDEPTVAQLIRDVLREEGHRVDAVLDGAEGLRLLSSSRPNRREPRAKPYDLVICDLKMPGVDGQAIYQSLVRSRHPARHSLLFVTGDTLARRTMEFLETSGVPFLAKPFLVDDLKRAVNRILPHKQMLANGEEDIARLVSGGLEFSSSARLAHTSRGKKS